MFRNGSGPLRDHVGKNRFTAQKHRGQIGIDIGSPVVELHVLHRAGSADRCYIDKDVWLADFGETAIYQAVHV